MEEKTIISGEITEQFRIWMERYFGFNVGRYVLAQRWVGKHIPCKYDPKIDCICDGYYGSGKIKLKDCFKWEIMEVNDFFFLRVWKHHGDVAKNETPKSFCVDFFIEKCIRIPEIEQLDMVRYGLYD